MKKKKTKEYEYHELVRVAKNVIFTLVVSDKDGKLKRTKEGEMIYQGLSSYIHMFGGRPPRDLNELLTYEHLHQLRFNWCKILCKSFKPFLPGLTVASMWRAIKKQRERYYKIKALQEKRLELNGPLHYSRYKDPKRLSEVSYVHVLNFNNDRIFPLHFDKYINFIVSAYKKEYNSDDFWKVKYLDNCDKRGFFKVPEFLDDADELFSEYMKKKNIPYAGLELGYSGTLYFRKGMVFYEE